MAIVVPKQADRMVDFWVMYEGQPYRIEHVRTYIPGKLPNGKDDVRHEVLLRNGSWVVTSSCERIQVQSQPVDGIPTLLADRVTEQQQAAFESAYALIPLANTIAAYLTATNTDKGDGPILDDEIIASIVTLENKLRAALRRRK